MKIDTIIRLITCLALLWIGWEIRNFDLGQLYVSADVGSVSGSIEVENMPDSIQVGNEPGGVLRMTAR
jgi:hypothetical protein